MLRHTLLGLTLLCSLPALATPVIGYARDTATQRYLYTEVHEQTLGPDGAVRAGVTTYFDAQGREMARKTLDFRLHRTVPLYRLDVPALQYAEGIRSLDKQAAVFKRDGQREEADTLPVGEGLVAADAGFNQLLQDQLPAIVKGETVRFGLIVAGYGQRFKFKARRVEEGPTGVLVRVEPDSMLRMLVAPIALRYDAASRRLLSYQGVSNILDPGTRQVYKDVSITYGGPAPGEARLPARLASVP